MLPVKGLVGRVSRKVVGALINRWMAAVFVSFSFMSPATTLVEWTGGTFTLNAGAQLNGAGLYKINNGLVTANANLTVENLDLVSDGSTLGGSGTLAIASLMNWTGGTMSGSGRTIISPGATLNVASLNGVSLTSRTLENGGPATGCICERRGAAAPLLCERESLSAVAARTASRDARTGRAPLQCRSTPANAAIAATAPQQNTNDHFIRSLFMSPIRAVSRISIAAIC